MTATPVNASLVLAASVGLAFGVRLAAWPLVRVVVLARADAAAPAAAPSSVGHPDSLAADLAAHDPFRLARRPAAVAYDPVRMAQPPTPPPPRPALALVGIVWDGGRDPAALMEGWPGTDASRAVHRGEAIGGLRVTSITANRVIITGLDTSWALIVREPWK
jgi:hypothetical protein